MCAKENGDSGRPSIAFIKLIGELARDKARREGVAPQPAPKSAAPVSPPPQKAAEPVAEPARGTSPPQRQYPGPSGKRTTPTDWLKVPAPGAAQPSKPQLTIIQADPKPLAAGFVTKEGPENIADAVFEAVNSGTGGTTRDLLSRAAQGVALSELEKGTRALGETGLRANSLVEIKVDNMKKEVPERFHTLIDESMAILSRNLAGSEPIVEKFMDERRWTRAEEDKLYQCIGAAAGDIQKLFDRRYDQESETRIIRREEPKGLLADTERKFAFTIIGSGDSHSNRETNVFDAFAKGVMFFYLIMQRPGSYQHAIGHPEISKPYDQLGGVEGAGIGAALRAYPQNLLLGSLFRCYSETHLVTIANDLRDALMSNPQRPLVGKFEHMVRQDAAEFEEAVRNSGLPPEMFFEVLNGNHTSDSLRSNKGLEGIFNRAKKEGLIFTKVDDLFDTLELLNDYMIALRMNPNARDFFMKFYLANYPLSENSGVFYKMFGMCLFDATMDIERRPLVKIAFEKDCNETVRSCFKKRLETLASEERETLVMGAPGAAPPKGSSKGETDFSDI